MPLAYDQTTVFIDAITAGFDDWTTLDEEGFTGLLDTSDTSAGSLVGLFAFRPDIRLAAWFSYNCQDSVGSGPGEGGQPGEGGDSTTLYGMEYYNMVIKMIRRDTRYIDVEVVLNGEAVDITDCTFKFSAKWEYYDNDAAAVFTRSTNTDEGITITDAEAGQLTIKIVPANTWDLPAHETPLVFDLEMTDTAGDVYTVLRGILHVYPDATANGENN